MGKIAFFKKAGVCCPSCTGLHGGARWSVFPSKGWGWGL